MLKAKNLQEFVLRHGGGDDQFFMGARKTPRIHAELCLDICNSNQNHHPAELIAATSEAHRRHLCNPIAPSVLQSDFASAIYAYFGTLHSERPSTNRGRM